MESVFVSPTGLAKNVNLQIANIFHRRTTILQRRRHFRIQRNERTRLTFFFRTDLRPATFSMSNPNYGKSPISRGTNHIQKYFFAPSWLVLAVVGRTVFKVRSFLGGDSRGSNFGFGGRTQGSGSSKFGFRGEFYTKDR